MSQLFIYLIADLLVVLIAIPWLFLISTPIAALVLGLMGSFYIIIGILILRPKERTAIRVLLVDDSPNTLVLINNILVSNHCIIKIVLSGLSAIEELARDKYDLIVLDYAMPGLNGSETLSLADQIISHQIPVVQYSSCREDSIKVETMNHFTLVGKLNKGMPPSMLRTQINRILNEVLATAS